MQESKSTNYAFSKENANLGKTLGSNTQEAIHYTQTRETSTSLLTIHPDTSQIMQGEQLKFGSERRLNYQLHSSCGWHVVFIMYLSIKEYQALRH